MKTLLKLRSGGAKTHFSAERLDGAEKTCLRPAPLARSAPQYVFARMKTDARPIAVERVSVDSEPRDGCHIEETTTRRDRERARAEADFRPAAPATSGPAGLRGETHSTHVR